MLYSGIHISTVGVKGLRFTVTYRVPFLTHLSRFRRKARPPLRLPVADDCFPEMAMR